MASQPVRTGWVVSTSFSAVTHGALIAVAVAATSQTVTAVRERHAAEKLERITYVEPSILAEAMHVAEAAKRADAARKAAAEKQRERDEALAALRKLADLPMDVPNVATQPDLTAVADAWLAQPDGFAAQNATTKPTTTPMNDLIAMHSGFIPPADGVYDENAVERSVEPKRGNPKPRYPVTLANMGVDGSFIVRFVVDSTGDVPPDRIEFPSTMDRLFVSAVRSALLKSHFAPAMVSGHVVAQQVIQEFRFVTVRRR
ncbi:MAG TPA: energy transducer TonB [Gemmatimonadaceae bacterium]